MEKTRKVRVDINNPIINLAGYHHILTNGFVGELNISQVRHCLYHGARVWLTVDNKEVFLTLQNYKEVFYKEEKVEVKPTVKEETKPQAPVEEKKEVPPTAREEKPLDNKK